MLHALFYYFSLISYIKKKMQEENAIVLCRFPCSLMCGDCMPQFHVRVCEAINYFNLQPVGIGRVQNDMQACIQSFLEAFSLFLVFCVQTKQNKTFNRT